MRRFLASSFAPDRSMSSIRQMAPDGCRGSPKGGGACVGSPGQFLLVADLSLLSAHHLWDPGQLEAAAAADVQYFFLIDPGDAEACITDRRLE